MSQDTFAALGVSAELTAVLEARGIKSPFQIQTRAIPPAPRSATLSRTPNSVISSSPSS